MTKKPSNEDSALFQEAMKGVKPLGSTKIVHEKRHKPLKKTVRFVEDDPPPPLDSRSHPEVMGDERLFFTAQGVQDRTLKQLKRGQLPCEAQLDLHYKTVQEAEDLVSRFLIEAQAGGLRCVRLIHGKGYSTPNQAPTLKNHVNRWLREHPAILAFCSAQNKDGGAGALYVLLRRAS